MNGVALIAAAVLLLAAAVLLLGGRQRPEYRLTQLRARQPGRRPSGGGRQPHGGHLARHSEPTAPRRPVLLRATPVLVAVAGWGLVGGWGGVIAAAVAGVGAWAVIRRVATPSATGDRRAAATELPYGVDLLAAVLRAGTPVDRALAVVGRALDSPLGRRFDEVGRALRLGVHGPDGWRALADVPGAAAVIAAAVRSAESGATLAAACSRAAKELRERRDAEADAAAQRAGVLIVLPLGACFLPAFVLVGVVPILLGVLHDVLA